MKRKRYSEFVYECIQNLKQKQEASKKREENKKKGQEIIPQRSLNS